MSIKAKSIKIIEGMLHKLTSEAYAENRAVLLFALEAIRARPDDNIANLMRDASAIAKSDGGVILQYIGGATSGSWIACFDVGPIACAETPHEALRAIIEKAKR